MRICAFLNLIAVGFAFLPKNCKRNFPAKLSLKASLGDSSWLVAELYASPVAKYNGELISQTIKVVEVAPKPADYVYGAVSNDGTPILAIGILFVVALGFIVPFILSIGESALVQQREREITNKIGENEFAKQARARQQKK